MDIIKSCIGCFDGIRKDFLLGSVVLVLVFSGSLIVQGVSNREIPIQNQKILMDNQELIRSNQDLIKAIDQRVDVVEEEIEER